MADVIDLGTEKILRFVRNNKSDEQKFFEAVAKQEHLLSGDKIVTEEEERLSLVVEYQTQNVTDGIMTLLCVALDNHGIDPHCPSMELIRSHLEEIIQKGLLLQEQAIADEIAKSHQLTDGDKLNFGLFGGTLRAFTITEDE